MPEGERPSSGETQTPPTHPSQPSATQDTYSHIYDVAVDYLGSAAVTMIPTGFENLDKALRGGLRPRSLYIYGGRVSEGKSSFAVSIARRIAFDQLLPVIYVSLESSKDEILEMAFCQQELVSLTDLEVYRQDGSLHERFKPSLTMSHLSRLHIEDDTGASIEEIRALLERMEKGGQPPPKLLIIDHLQHITFANGMPTPDAITYYLAELKRLAKSKEMVIFVCSQLNRQVYETKDKQGNIHPTLIHLRGSGGIEQVADVVLLGHRMNYADRLTEEDQERDAEYEIIIDKNRRGPRLTLSMTFRARCFEFIEPVSQWEPKRPPAEVKVVD